MFNYRKYNGENTLMMPSAAPVFQREKICITCVGMGKVTKEIETDDPDIWLEEVIDCPDCDGEGKIDIYV